MLSSNSSSHSCFRFAIAVAALSLAVAGEVAAQSQANRGPRVSRHFESIRKSPPELLAFLLAMPKGADLHSHLSGAVYAESYVQWAAARGMCLSPAMTLSSAPCDSTRGQQPVSNALTNSVLYRQLVDAWSTRNWQYSGQS